MAVPSQDVTEVFAELGELEKEFANVEIDACTWWNTLRSDREFCLPATDRDLVRTKEFKLRALYSKRKALLDRIPDFWPTVFCSGPREVQQYLQPQDRPLFASLKSFTIDRYQIESEDKGEPRSLRFTFEFAPNDFIEDTKLVKEFEYQPHEDGPGHLTSKPVPIKWKSKKKDLTFGLLDGAVELFKAEEALQLKNGNTVIEIVDREALWQHEKLREKLVEIEDSSEPEQQVPSFFTWFGFRGAVNPEPKKKPAENGAEEADEDEEDEEDDFEEMLEVEVFPPGEDLATSLAEGLWVEAMDYFMWAQEQGDGFDFDGDAEDDDDEEVPELVEDVGDEPDRPRKKQRKA